MAETVTTPPVFGPSAEPPAGAILLTEEMFEATSKEWVRLPFMSMRLAKMSVPELIRNRYLFPVDRWTDEAKDQMRTRLAMPKLPGLPENADDMGVEYSQDVIDAEKAKITDAELLETRAKEVREQGVWVEISIVGFTEALSVQPVIPGSESWPQDPAERSKAFTDWFNGLSEEEKKKYSDALADANYRFIHMGLVTPKLNLEQVRRFKDDAQFLALSISRLSGLDRSRAPEDEKKEEKPAETSDGVKDAGA